MRAMARVRRILHVDMDAFYASVEQRDRPELRGRPVVVGGRPDQRGVVAAASYEARRFGIHSALPMARAVRLCPDVAIVHPDFSKYHAVSQQVFEIFHSVTSLVEPLSLDEAYLDVTENAWDEPLGVNVARRIKALILERTRLTASAGVAPNKFLAKIASGWKKPDGLTVIGPSRIEPFLQGLSVDALWGVGPVTARRLHAAGIRTVLDVRAAGEARLHEVVGNLAGWLVQLARGEDDRAVEPERPAKSSGTENTYPQDLTDIGRMRDEVASMAREGAAWLLRHELFARTVTIKVRYGNFQTVTRSHSARPATRDADAIAARAVELLEKTEAARRPVRLLGVSVHHFSDAPGEASPERPCRPLPLFDPLDES